MPHLQFEINKKVSDESKEIFVNEIRKTFSEVMDTGTEHISISLREYDKYNLTIGRADINDDICLMNLDIRVGRTIEKRRELALLEEEIKDLMKRITDLSDENSVLFLWTIDKYLFQAQEIAEGLGYKLHARMIWNKVTGIPAAFTVRYGHEYLLYMYKFSI